MPAKRTSSSSAAKKGVAGRSPAKKSAAKRAASTSLTRSVRKFDRLPPSGIKASPPKVQKGLQKVPKARVRTVEKVSLTVPTAVMELVRERAPQGEVSAYVSQALQRQLERDALEDLLSQMEAENGPVTDAEVEKALALWPDA